MLISEWLKDTLILAQQRSNKIIMLCSKGRLVIGYISAGTEIRKQNGEIVIILKQWIVSAIKIGRMWQFDYEGETFTVDERKFMPIDGE